MTTSTTTPFTFAGITELLDTAEQTRAEAVRQFQAKTVLLEGLITPWNFSKRIDTRQGVYPATTKDGDEHPFAGRGYKEARVKFDIKEMIAEQPEQIPAHRALATLRKHDLVLRMTWIEDSERESGMTAFSSRVNMPYLTGALRGLVRVRGRLSFNLQCCPIADVDEHGHASDLTRAQWVNHVSLEQMDEVIPEGFTPVRIMAEIQVRSLYQKPLSREAQAEQDHDDLPPMEEVPTEAQAEPVKPRVVFGADPLEGIN